MRKLVGIALGGVVALSMVAGPASAGHFAKSGKSHSGKSAKIHSPKPPKVKSGSSKSAKKSLLFLGLVTSLTQDLDPITQDTLTFTSLKGNRHARDYLALHPGDVTVVLPADVKYKGVGAFLGSFRMGDGVKVKAREVLSSLGTSLVAHKVSLKLHAYEGTLLSLDALSATLMVTEANQVGSAWLAAHANPSPLGFVVTPTTKLGDEDDTPIVGVLAKIKARPTVLGTSLEALKIKAEDSEP
jgi:hypothetical protein